MRWLGVLCACVIVTPLTLVRAEPRRTLEEVTLRKKPGEKEPVIARVPANTEVTVLGIEGRWLRVRALGNEGYLTRTTVSAPEPGDAAPSGSWSAARKVDGKLVSDLFVEVVAARAVLRAEPRPDAAQVAELSRGARLTVVDAGSDPAWIHVRDDARHDGWIGRAAIDNGASAVVVTGVDLRGLGGSRDPVRGAAAARPLTVRAELGLGLRALGMDLTSNAEGGLTNYVLDAEAAAATLDVDAVRRLGGTLFVAADVRAAASRSSPGIAYPGPSGPAGTIAFRTMASDLGIRLGTRARRVFDLALRAGGHYDVFFTTDVKNAGRLPREHLFGATLGARVDVAPPGSRFAVTARVDALVLGARAQTEGLEDGASSTARALWGGVIMRYAVGRRVAVFGGYDASRATTEWTGMSVRQPGATRTRRVDTAQLVQLGIGAEL